MGECIMTSARGGFIQEPEVEIPVDGENTTIVVTLKDSSGYPIKNALIRARYQVYGANLHKNSYGHPGAGTVYFYNEADQRKNTTYTNNKGMCYFQINSENSIELTATGELRNGGFIVDLEPNIINCNKNFGNIIETNITMGFRSGGVVIGASDSNLCNNVNLIFRMANKADIYLIGGGGTSMYNNIRNTVAANKKSFTGGGGALNYSLNKSITRNTNYSINILNKTQNAPPFGGITGGSVFGFGMSANGGYGATGNFTHGYAGAGGGENNNKGGNGYGANGWLASSSNLGSYDNSNQLAAYSNLMSNLNNSTTFCTSYDSRNYIANNYNTNDYHEGVDVSKYGMGGEAYIVLENIKNDSNKFNRFGRGDTFYNNGTGTRFSHLNVSGCVIIANMRK